MVEDIDSQGTHTLTIKPDKSNQTKIGTFDFDIPPVSLTVPKHLKFSMNSYCVDTCPTLTWEKENYPLWPGKSVSETLTLNVPPPTLTFVCVAGEYLNVLDRIPSSFVSLTLTSIQCSNSPITITDNDGTVLIDLTSKIEQEVCIAIENTQPEFVKIKGSDQIYTIVKIGSFKESFEKTYSDDVVVKYDITITLALELCLSAPGTKCGGGMGLYLKIGIDTNGSVSPFSYKGFNPFVKTINDEINDYDDFVHNSCCIPDDWEIKDIKNDALTVKVPGLGPVNTHTDFAYLMCFLPFEPENVT
jgi:hypothetical protein